MTANRTHSSPEARRRRSRRIAAALSLAVPLALAATACSPDEGQAGSASEQEPTTVDEGTATTVPADMTAGAGTFTTPEDADRTDVESTAEVAALIMHSWDTTMDTTQTDAAIRAVPLMSNEWAANQVEPKRNGAQGEWLEPAEHEAYSAPSIVPASGDVSKDVAADKAVRAYDVSWRWISRDGTELPNTGRQIVTIYLEKHDGQWDVVFHQFQDMGQ
ncbi:hypothetical protein PTW37_17455 (plasmid) [Arthrobacter agilis]|uniref:hypothetical protein n=1 Tax=Arthrobacter agilis TaxID=37921 RepID=UPI0023668476|nr:hypothetical protein [Arthrobacter agilis]WDF35303.1 hypothetical protein PTW37_17455 [Arthrobacter agilis]